MHDLATRLRAVVDNDLAQQHVGENHQSLAEDVQGQPGRVKRRAPGGRSLRRSPEHRRAGPGRPHPARTPGDAGPPPPARRPPAPRPDPGQWVLAGALVPAVALVLARRRLRIPPPVTLGIVSLVPLAVAAVHPRRRWRYAVVGAAYMWSFTLTWTLPYERADKLRERLRVDYPSASTPSSAWASPRPCACSGRSATRRA